MKNDILNSSCKMIARNVQSIPLVLKNTFFSHCKTLVVNENDFIDIDSIPCYMIQLFPFPVFIFENPRIIIH